MPGPFPGMDPFLESPEHWHNVHHLLIAQISAQLNQALPPGFAAEIGEKVYVVPADSYLPDVAVLRQITTARNPTAPTGNVATIAPTPALRIEIVTEEVRLAFIEVTTTRGRREVVTAIEVLSPVNKRGAGREQYLAKQRDLLASRTHLLEIDLLRGGEHTVAVPEESLKAQAPHWDYLVCLHRAADTGFSCWPTTVRDPLPTVSVPLTDTEPDLLLSLQILFERLYEEGPFRRTVDYQSEPTPRLRAADRRWSDALLRNRGLR